MKKLFLIILCAVIGILVYKKNDEIIIPSDAIRVRIIANSNNIEDLYQKKQIKESIKNDLYGLVKDAKNSVEASNILKNNIKSIKEIVKKRTNNFTIDYGSNYFPKKEYKGVIYPEGNYNSLVITLGNGLGDNWWCVLYPPLCLIDDNPNTSDIEYKLLIKGLL